MLHKLDSHYEESVKAHERAYFNATRRYLESTSAADNDFWRDKIISNKFAYEIAMRRLIEHRKSMEADE